MSAHDNCNACYSAADDWNSTASRGELRWWDSRSITVPEAAEAGETVFARAETNLREASQQTWHGLDPHDVFNSSGATRALPLAEDLSASGTGPPPVLWSALDAVPMRAA